MLVEFKNEKEQKRVALKIAQTFIFAGAHEEAIDTALVSEYCYREKFDAGETIYETKNFKRALGIVLSGEVAVLAVYREGECARAVPLRCMKQNDVFGAAAMFGEEERYATVIRAKKGCEILFMEQPLVAALLWRNPGIALNYITFLSGRIRYLNQKIDSFTAGSARSRLARYLLEYAKQNDTDTLHIPTSNLASTLDIGRASLYRAAGELTRAKCIEKNGKEIKITDILSLRKEAD